MFSGCYFAQVLEGPRDAVEASLSRIGGDARHTDLRVVLERPIDRRAYADWSMAYLHDLGLEDDVAALVTCDDSSDPGRVGDVMSRLTPDTVMGALR
jgi:hypothetical protein